MIDHKIIEARMGLAPTYPEVRLEWAPPVYQHDNSGSITKISDGFYEAFTILRKKSEDDGKYYGVLFINRFFDFDHQKLTKVQMAENVLSRIHTEVYKFIHLGIVNKELIYPESGKSLYHLLDDQTDETERVKKRYTLEKYANIPL